MRTRRFLSLLGEGFGWLLSLTITIGSGCPAVSALDHPLVISAYQGPCVEGDFSANLATVRRVVEEARARSSHFVVFPETFLSGYESRDRVEAGAREENDPELLEFIRESAVHDTVILVGLARRVGAKLFNSVLVIHRGRLVGSYDKILLTHGDRHELGFSPGTAVPVFHAHGINFAAIICHDSSFPHVALAARYQGAQLLFSPHYNEIGEGAVEDHRRWVRNCHVGLACQFKMAVVRANIVKASRAGRLGYGGSFILSPQGEPLAEAKLFRTELITATVTPAMYRAPYVWADLHETPAWLRSQTAALLTQFRPLTDEPDQREWLENMVVYHGYSDGEVSAATGLTLDEASAAVRKFGLRGRPVPVPLPGESLRVLPYPGGRHPRIGFLEGAIMPQRETKISVIPPWTDGGYVVVDVPEAIFSNLGLTYLAHTHIPTIWDEQGIELERLEWIRREDGSLEGERLLPNGIAFGMRVASTADKVRMELWLRNGTDATLTGLRVQNCVMLKGARGFAEQTDANKLVRSPYAACRTEDGRRWVITAWKPLHRVWVNAPLPCLHSDPQFPDCPPGATVRVRGFLSFYEGVDIVGELDRLEAAGW